MVIFSGITHVILGLGLYFYLFDGNVILLIFVAVGSLLPDIDIKSSMLGRLNPFAGIMKHRGSTHTMAGAALFSLLVSVLLKWQYGMALGFGYLLHLIGDTFTPMGIMWLYPYSKKYHSIFPKR